MKEYNHNSIEKKWQEEWEKQQLFQTPRTKENADNLYMLVEFPYPSGNLHVGHWYAFSVPDIFARKKRMEGYNVLFPIGFDSFGLPAENAAIKRGLDPSEWTRTNIEYMIGQLKRMGASFDWSRQIRTSDPSYYTWTQWLFTQLFNNGIAYRGKATVNWCPSCQTVLANEQVTAGLCERCDTEVSQRMMPQWMLRITNYAEKLLEGLEGLSWPKEIKESQRNWIGRKTGATFSFEISISNEKESEKQPVRSGKDKSKNTIEVFTTRPDTFFGVTFLVVSPEKVQEWIEGGWDAPEGASDYIHKSLHKTERERLEEGRGKSGVYTGITALHPETEKEIPVWVADYVLGGYGSGAVMAVPAHDERDFEFAKKFDLPVKEVVLGGEVSKEAYVGEGILTNSGDFNGMKSREAGEKITQRFGESDTTYRLRDWSVGRQRYWGCPIPIVYDPEGRPHAVPAEHLPWLLPDDVDHTPTGTPPLARSQELKERTKAIFGEGWSPEVETMDTFLDSSWYFLRYTDPHNDEVFAAQEKMSAWMPVDHYSGGAEHTTMHLLYSRFFHKALFDLGLVNEEEPYISRRNRGLILGPDGAKMSKSRGNVIDPDKEVEKYGADTVRTYLAFIGPYNEVGTYPWSPESIVGVRRFIERVWRLRERTGGREAPEETYVKMHQTIRNVGESIEGFKINTAVSSLMILLNHLERLPAVPEGVYETFLKLLAPLAPHITEELWRLSGHDTSIHLEKWPEYDEQRAEPRTVTIAVQVDGVVRDTFDVPAGISKEEGEKRARESGRVKSYLADTKVEKVIFVPDKIVNFVTHHRHEA